MTLINEEQLASKNNVIAQLETSMVASPTMIPHSRHDSKRGAFRQVLTQNSTMEDHNMRCVPQHEEMLKNM